MINPSINGWIEKYFIEQNQQLPDEKYDALTFYKHIRKTGIIYGHTVSVNTITETDYSNWNLEEITKVGLLSVLYECYSFTEHNSDADIFIEKVVNFYKKISPKSWNFFDKLIDIDTITKLESVIDERVQTNKDAINKKFSHIITNALLFTDVLAFRYYLINDEISKKYLKSIEETIINIITISLKYKRNKNVNDNLLMKLFEASVRYSTFSEKENITLEDLSLENYSDDLEKYFLIDLAVLVLWADEKVDNEELYFLHKLGETIGVSDEFINKSIEETNNFIIKNKKEIHYFNYSNPVKHFYDQTTNSVIFLIKRNKKRLTKELLESKELVQLLAKSTKKDLDFEEKKKVKKQLLDVCKSIPSLTIFLLPGGALLLPILIKFIPQLLPSAFNENLED